MMRSTLPLGTIVNPIVDSETRNKRYASAELILFGAITVTFFWFWRMRGSRMKFLHVNPITQVMRSLSSVSGLNVIATCPVRFLQLYSDSSSPGAGVFALGVVGVVGAGCANVTRGVQAPAMRPAMRPAVRIVATNERGA